MMTRKRGFTLLELLVIMGIIAAITGMGIYGLSRFQANTQVQTAANDTITLLRTVQNDARNSVSFVDDSSLDPSICSSNGNCVPDYYGVNFDSQGYHVYGCLQSGSNIVCPSQNEIEIDGVSFPGITFSYIGTACGYISFERLTGDIKDVNGNPLWTVSSNSICTIRISNTFGDNKSIEVNLLTNAIRDVGV